MPTISYGDTQKIAVINHIKNSLQKELREELRVAAENIKNNFLTRALKLADKIDVFVKANYEFDKTELIINIGDVNVDTKKLSENL